MPLFWIVHELDGKRRIFIVQAGAPITARIKASIAGFDGTFVEAHELDDKSAKRVPQKDARQGSERGRDRGCADAAGKSGPNPSGVIP